MTKLQNTGWVIAIILAVVLWLSHCDDKPDIKPETEYIYDTTTYTETYTDTVKEDTIIYKTIPANVDTANILKDYFASRTYSRTHTDSNITITIQDTVSENKLGAWTVKYKINRPTQINNTYKPERKSIVFVGAEFSQGVGINVGYMSKSNLMIDAGYYPNSGQIRVGVRFGVRL